METQTTDLVINRVFDAPRELVWKAWSEAERLAQWWGPKDSRIQICRLEFRRDGVFHYSMKMPDGSARWGKFVYHEISPVERLVFVNSFADESGNIVRAPFSPTFPLEVQNTVTLTESGTQTTLTLRGAPINATEAERATFQSMHASMQQGFGGALDQLATYLATA
ncbi:putative conserved protein YndB, AHSA1/START domain [Abditibacterium utsteinense]|uniref:Putative conserved protein YndB, AHSA1/START domain n=1 Tax=Abditibacterium utsteinense TaxID=1960156 RepID=A0A2S8STK4_9BACT|nr:SRPBCC domain-containing protein [Abditibacterium utsteinense]PQV64134.1 putative conserved protein YndB, AHSA1/START domain [Abditibacterium utsteinense]